MNATFLHFIFMQTSALVWAFLYKQTLLTDLSAIIEPSWPSVKHVYIALQVTGSFVGALVFVYSLVLVVAASITVYRIARIVDPAP
jgi:hypothetical protein